MRVQAAEIADGQPPPVGLDQPQGPERAERWGRRLTRPHAPTCELVLGDRNRNVDRAGGGAGAESFGRVDQPAGDPGQARGGRELALAGVRDMQPVEDNSR
jgi:hypothetical protein